MVPKVTKGRICAKKREPDNAIKYYTEVVDASESPRDVTAMALFNRALVYAAIGKLRQATEDLKAILGMPEAIAKMGPAELLAIVDPYCGSTEGQRYLRGGKRPDLEEVTDWIEWAQGSRTLAAA